VFAASVHGLCGSTARAKATAPAWQITQRAGLIAGAERNLCASRGAVARALLRSGCQMRAGCAFAAGMRFAQQLQKGGSSMANVQTSKSANEKNKNAQRSKSQDVESETGERDETYNLISVLYHALQGAETIRQYQQDAEQSGDEQLAQFFDETRSGYTEFAQQAKRLLAERMEDDEDEDEAEEE
jgi:hypothetical protein